MGDGGGLSFSFEMTYPEGFTQVSKLALFLGSLLILDFCSSSSLFFIL